MFWNRSSHTGNTTSRSLPMMLTYISRPSIYCSAMASVPMRSWMKLTRSASFSSCRPPSLRDAVGGSSLSALDDQRKSEPRRPLHLAADRKHGELRHRDAVIMQELLRQRLAARDDHAARIASGIRHLQQLEVAHDILVEDHLAVELLQQVEHHVRLPVLDRVADRQSSYCTPRARTSWPIARRSLTTSYSVFQTLISSSVCPRSSRAASAADASSAGLAGVSYGDPSRGVRAANELHRPRGEQHHEFREQFSARGPPRGA